MSHVFSLKLQQFNHSLFAKMSVYSFKINQICLILSCSSNHVLPAGEQDCSHTYIHTVMGLNRKDGGEAIHREFTLPALRISQWSKCIHSSHPKVFTLIYNLDTEFKWIKVIVLTIRQQRRVRHLDVCGSFCCFFYFNKNKNCDQISKKRLKWNLEI